MARKMTFSGAKYRSNGGPGDEYNKTRTTKVEKTKPDPNAAQAAIDAANALVGKMDPTGKPYTKASAMQKVRYDEQQKNKKRPS